MDKCSSEKFMESVEGRRLAHCAIWDSRWVLYLPPPPSLESIALDLLCKSHQVHPKTSHGFIVPNLMTYEWKRPLGKASDTKFVLNINSFI